MTIPTEAKNALLCIQNRLANSLVAVHLHGSAARSGLRPKSDVDLIAVIDQSMTSEVRKLLITDLMKISGHFPIDSEGRHPLELIIFLRSDLSESTYPPRSEFIYGEWMRHKFEAGEIPEPVWDPDLTLVLAQARQDALPLIGPQANDLLPAMPKSLIQQAIRDSLPNLCASLLGDERNVLLTLARMWRTASTGDFVTKDVAAEWAATQLPTEQAWVLLDARNAYLSGIDCDWRTHQPEILRTVITLNARIMACGG